MRRIKKGDTVIVIAWKHKWKVSEVEKVRSDGQFVWLKWVNVAKKAVKGQGFVEKILPIHVSNVMLYLKDKEQAVKTRFEIDAKGKKKRVAKKLEIAID